MLDLVEVLGLIAGILTTLSFIPQIKKVWITKSVRDISILMYVMYCSGLLLWSIYGVLINSISIMIANSLTLVFALSILAMKMRWSDRETT